MSREPRPTAVIDHCSIRLPALGEHDQKMGQLGVAFRCMRRTTPNLPRRAQRSQTIVKGQSLRCERVSETSRGIATLHESVPRALVHLTVKVEAQSQHAPPTSLEVTWGAVSSPASHRQHGAILLGSGGTYHVCRLVTFRSREHTTGALRGSCFPGAIMKNLPRGCNPRETFLAKTAVRSSFWAVRSPFDAIDGPAWPQQPSLTACCIQSRQPK